MADRKLLSTGFIAALACASLPIGIDVPSGPMPYQLPSTYKAPAIAATVDTGGHRKRRKKNTPSRAKRKKVQNG